MSNVRVLGARPSVATKRSEEAVSSIRLKIRILSEWAASGIPMLSSTTEQNSEWCPSSLREFSNWDGSQNSAELRSRYPGLRRCSRQTLTHHANLKNEVEQVLMALKAREASLGHPQEPERDYRLEFREETKRRQSIERAYLESQRLVRDLKALNQRTKRIAEHEKRELREELDAANARLRFQDGKQRREK